MTKFYAKKSELNFYTQKNENHYKFDKYWNIFY